MIYGKFCELLREVGRVRASDIMSAYSDFPAMQLFTSSERQMIDFRNQIIATIAEIDSLLDSFDIYDFEHKLLKACNWSVDIDSWEANLENFTADEFLVFVCIHEARRLRYRDTSNSVTFKSLVLKATRMYESSLRNAGVNRRLGDDSFYGLPVFHKENSENFYDLSEFIFQGERECRDCGHNAGGAWKRCPKCFCSERCLRCKNFCVPIVPKSAYARLLERLSGMNLRINYEICLDCFERKLVQFEPKYCETDLGPARFLTKQIAKENQIWSAIEPIFEKFDEADFVSIFSSGTPDEILFWFELQDRDKNPTGFQIDFDEVTATTRVLEEIKLPVNLANLRRYCNLSAEQVLYLIDSGLDVDKAAPLLRQGISVDDLPLGLHIGAFGLDSSTCQLLITNGIETRHLNVFKERPKVLKNAIGILKAGVKISGPDKLLEWAEIDLDPGDISKWIRSGCNAQVTQSWMSNGFDWREAKAWIKSAGVKDPTIAARRRSAGITP